MRLVSAALPRSLQRGLLAAAMIVPLALAACDSAPSVEALTRQQQSGDYEGTLEPLRALLEASPDDPELNFLYGRALAFTQPHLAIWSLRKSMQEPDWLVRAGTQLAFLALAGDDFNEVYKITDQILEREPDNVRVLLIRANAYAHSRKEPERAVAAAKRVLELKPDAAEAYEPLILGLLGLERFDEAKQALAEAGKQLVALERDDRMLAWHCATTATFEQESGDHERAATSWEKCLAEYPSDPDVVSSAVAFHDARRDYARSLEILQAAQASSPDSRGFRTTLARRLHGTGAVAEAEALLREATSSSRPLVAAEAWMELARLRQSAGEFGAAAEAMERAVDRVTEIEEPSPQLMFELADALVLAERFDRALEVAEKLTVPAHRGLIRGRVAQERRDPVRALAEFDEALLLWPDNPWARYYAALAAEELGDFERALVEYRNAIRIEPGATDARSRAASMLLAEGDLASAWVILHTAGVESPLPIEGRLLAIRMAGRLGNTVEVAEELAMVEALHPEWAGTALASAAEGVAEWSSSTTAVDMLVNAPGVDFGDPRYAAALRALVRYAHERGASDDDRAAWQSIFDRAPDSSVFQEIRALDLELGGAPVAEVIAAYGRAVALGPSNADALAALGRLHLSNDPTTAAELLDRAAVADPTDPGPPLAVARAVIALGRPDEAAERLDRLLLEHPYEADAAALRAELDLEAGKPSAATLERARRAARFGGGADAFELLSRVHHELEEPELAAQAAERARTLRASDG